MPLSPSSAAAAAGPECTTVWVLGASGDLAHKKTFPSIFDLFVADLLPRACAVVGFARTAMTDAAFRETLRKYLPADEARRAAVDAFLQLCVYRQGAYGDAEAFARVSAHTVHTPNHDAGSGFCADSTTKRQHGQLCPHWPKCPRSVHALGCARFTMLLISFFSKGPVKL